MLRPVGICPRAMCSVWHQLGSQDGRVLLLDWLVTLNESCCLAWPQFAWGLAMPRHSVPSRSGP